MKLAMQSKLSKTCSIAVVLTNTTQKKLYMLRNAPSRKRKILSSCTAQRLAGMSPDLGVPHKRFANLLMHGLLVVCRFCKPIMCPKTLF